MSSSQDAAPLSGRVALVTGATRGIGRACAVALGEAGAHVIALGRTQGALEELDDELRKRTGREVTLVPLDLADGPALDALGGAIFQRHAKLDILVHAAGMLGGLRPVAHIPPELWDRILAVNVTSVFRLIRSLEPLMRASDAGRAIFLSSVSAAHPKAFWGSDAATKAAVEALARSWADEVDVSPVRVAIVNPGPTRTRMRAEAYPGEDPLSLPEPSALAPLILEICLNPDPGAPVETIDFRAWQAAQSAPAPSV